MKENIKKAVFWGISLAIGFIIADIIRGNGIDWMHVIIGGVTMCVVDFIFNLIGDNRRNGREEK